MPGPTQIGTFVDETNQSFFFGSNQQPSLFLSRGNLYLFQIVPGIGGGTAQVYKSTDDGNTWTVLDSTHAPPVGNAIAVLDGNQLIVTAQPFSLVNVAFVLQNFNLLTETWGVAYGVGSPTVNGVFAVFKRPDSSIVVIYDTGNPPPGGTSRLRAIIWNGASWSASIDLGANYLGVEATGNINVAATSAVMDPSGRIHAIFTNNGSTPWTAGKILFYQALEITNALGNFFNFTGIGTTPRSFYNNVIVHQNSLIFTIQTIGGFDYWVGANLANPVWTRHIIGPAAGVSQTSGNIVSTGTQLVFMGVYTDGTGNNTFLVLFVSNDNGTTWINLNPSAPYFYYFGGGSPVPPTANPANSIPVTNNLYILFPGGVPTVYSFLSVVDGIFFSPVIGLDASFQSIPSAPPPTPPFPIVVPTVVSGPFLNGVPIAGIVALPDPKLLCHFNGRAKCVIIGDIEVK